MYVLIHLTQHSIGCENVCNSPNPTFCLMLWGMNEIHFDWILLDLNGSKLYAVDDMVWQKASKYNKHWIMCKQLAMFVANTKSSYLMVWNEWALHLKMSTWHVAKTWLVPTCSWMDTPSCTIHTASWCKSCENKILTLQVTHGKSGLWTTYFYQNLFLLLQFILWFLVKMKPNSTLSGAGVHWGDAILLPGARHGFGSKGGSRLVFSN